MLAQEALLELENLAHVHAHDERLGRGNVAVDQQDIVEFVIAGRQGCWRAC